MNASPLIIGVIAGIIGWHGLAYVSGKVFPSESDAHRADRESARADYKDAFAEWIQSGQDVASAKRMAELATTPGEIAVRTAEFEEAQREREKLFDKMESLRTVWEEKLKQ